MLFPSREAFQTYALEHAETLVTFSPEVQVPQPDTAAQTPQTPQQSTDKQFSQSQPPAPATQSDQQPTQQQQAPQEKQPTQNQNTQPQTQQNQNAVTPAPQPTAISISVTVPPYSTADLRPGIQGALIAKFQLQSSASERVELNEIVFDDGAFTRGGVSPFKKLNVSINNTYIPLEGASAITIDVLADIDPVIPARLHDVLLGNVVVLLF